MSKKILLVDDDQYLRELYEEVLQSEGYEVETASDGKVGLNKITTNKYDLILLDVMLPQLDGLGILTKLKESGSNVPMSSIILMTNLAHDPVVRKALDDGVKSCLIKSDLTPDKLVEEIKDCLGGESPENDQKENTNKKPAKKVEVETI
jgi:DNA-binding response OmpR family regulator